jgi:hypothetical protein
VVGEHEGGKSGDVGRGRARAVEGRVSDQGPTHTQAQRTPAINRLLSVREPTTVARHPRGDCGNGRNTVGSRSSINSRILQAIWEARPTR